MINVPTSLVPDGTYVVELLFAQIDNDERFIDVFLEEQLALGGYRINRDWAAIATQPNSENELDVTQLMQNKPIAKRFSVSVTDGLDIELHGVEERPFAAGALLNGLRVLRVVESIFPGDYDRNGAVECYDYQLWRATFGLFVTPFTGADGNGNGVIDAADYVIWADAYDAIAGHPIGDFDGNGVVNAADYSVWYATFGSMSDLRADANCNGTVDAADYVIWRDTVGSAVGAARFGLLDAAFDPDVPPEVVDLVLSAGGVNSFGFFGIVGSGEQLRSVPLAGASSVSLTFNQAVIVTQSALVLVNLDGAAPSVASFLYTAESQTATWTFAAPLADGRYLVRLADSVHDADNEALDGEFTNPWTLSETNTSVLPSGDGEAGGEFRFRFTMLAGDTDHNNIDGAINYQNWKSTEPGMVYVSTTTDDFDADLSFGDVSLREAVNYANTAAEPTLIDLPAGHYYLSRSGTESTTNTDFNDLDIFGNVKILGAGPGATVIDGGTLVTDDRIFDVVNLGTLNLSRVTLALGQAPNTSGLRDGGAVRIQNGGQLDLDYSAVVGNVTGRSGDGGAIYFAATGHGSITNSVITVNEADDNTGGVFLASTTGTGGSVTVANSIIVNNSDSSGTHPDVFAGTNRTFTSGGYNRLGNAATGFTDGVNGDYIKPSGSTVHYVVTSIVDTYDGSADPVNMSLRDAIHLANSTAGTQEIWLPAWDFVLTRQRTTAANLPELNVSEGDLEITDSVIIRGINGTTGPATSIAWMTGAVADKVFELVGDYNGNSAVDTSDYVQWLDQVNQSGSDLAADGDDDGDVDQDDYNIWVQNFGHTLQMSDLLS